MNGNLGTHTRDNILAAIIVERDDYRDALPHLGEISTGRVLVRQKRKLAGSRLDNLLHVAAKSCTAIGVDANIDRLADTDIADGVLINISGHRYGAEIGHFSDCQARRDGLILYRGNLQNGAVPR